VGDVTFDASAVASPISSRGAPAPRRVVYTPRMMPETVAAARALLPAWVVWFPALAAVWAGIAAALAVGLPVLIAARPLSRLAPDAHWTERARATWPARRVAWAGVLAAGVTGTLAWTGGPLSRPLGAASGALAVASALAAALAVLFAVENRLVRPIPLARRAAGIATWLLALLPAYVLALLSPAFTQGATGPRVTAAFAVAVVALQAGGGLALGRALRLVRPAPERVRAALAEACAGRAGALPGAWELPLVAANALAFPLRNAIGVTPALLAIVDDAELAGILRHEVAHLDEPRRVKLARFGAGLAVPAGIIGAGSAGLATPFWAVLCLAGALLTLLLLLRVARRMEERADRAAAPATGVAYARALERIYAHNLAPATLHRRATHPDLFDRMAAAGVAPAWPRPAPPRAPRLPLAILVLALAALGTTALTLRDRLEREAASGRGGALLALAVRQDARTLWWLSTWETREGSLDDAVVLLGAAGALAPEDGELATRAALWSAGSGRCDQARDALARAERAGASGPEVDAARAMVAACLPRR
jgi:Zn-dependent protease with chaperone function